MQVLKVIFIILEVILLFNLVILVHELGHFLAARWRGLKVDRFGIWFGKPIWEKKINGVVYCLGTIPAGGFVALPQMAPMEAIEGKNVGEQEVLPPIKPIDKIIVALAGPVFSFLLAVVFACIIYWIGRPVSEKETSTTIGYVEKESPAEKVGLLAGDKILAVDGAPVDRFSGVSDSSVMWRIVRSEGTTVGLRVDRAGQITNFYPVPEKASTRAWERKSLRQIGVHPAFSPMIGRVAEHSPAAVAGLKPTDILLEANGKKLHHPGVFSSIVQESGTNAIQVKVQRGNEEFVTQIKPEIPLNGEKVPRIGVVWDDTGKMALVHPGPVEQLRAAIGSMVSTFGALFSPKSDIKAQHLSGPVGIMRIYYLLFESEQGWRMAIWFSVVLNINLAILNMLPIPVLDGGHITLAIIEGIRRKPINVKILGWIQTACAMLVIGYLLYVTFFDVQDLRSGPKEPDTEMKFAPKDQTTPIVPGK